MEVRKICVFFEYGIARKFIYLIVLTALFLYITPLFGQQVFPISPQLSTLIFGQVNFRERQNVGDDGFVLGQGVGQFNLKINDHLSAFSEIVGTQERNGSPIFSAERYIVRYDFSDKSKLSGGRYHTPISYWNYAFHHGYWLQTTIGRPEVVKPHSYVVPLHFLGSLLEGNVGDSNFYYRAGFGNGRSEVINDVDNWDNVYKKPAGLLGLIYRSTDRNRFESGISAYFDKPAPMGGTEVNEVILNGYFVLQSETPEIIVEYTWADHKSSQEKGNVNSVYAQFAYRLEGGESKLKLYSRIEYLNVSRADPLLGTRNLDYDGILAGVRWDFSSFAALKAEFRNEKFEKQDRQNSAWLQLALYFDASASTQKFFASLRKPNKSITQ